MNRNIRNQALMSHTWFVISVLLVGQMVESFTYQGPPTLYPFIQEAFDLSRAELGLISSGLILGAAGSTLLMGWLADAVGVRRLITVTSVCVAALVVAFSLVQSLVQVVLVALVMSAAASGTYPACVKGITGWVRPHMHAMAMGIQGSAVPVSGAAAALLLPTLAVNFSWHIGAMALALMILVSGMVFLALYRDVPGGGNSPRERTSPVKSISLVARNRDIWLASVTAMTLSALQVVFVAYLILFLKQELGMSTVVAGAFLAVSQVSSVVWRVAWGLASDFLFHRRRVVALALMSALSVGSMGLMAWLPSDASLLLVGVVVSVVGVGFMGWASVHPVLLAELAGPKLTGTVIGFGVVIQRVGSFGIPPLFGLVVDQTDSYDTGWWVLAGVAGAGGLALAFLKKGSRRL